MRPAIHVAVRHEPLEPDSLLDRVGTPEDGAVVLFVGVVRNHHEGSGVEFIEYEGYAPMVVELLERLSEEVASRFHLSRVGVDHRLGVLRVGEASIAVAVSSPHRREAFEGAAWLMDELKAQIPVWKKERRTDGGGDHWVTGVDPRTGRSR